MSTEYKTLPDEPGYWWTWSSPGKSWKIVLIRQTKDGWSKGHWIKIDEPDPPLPPRPRMVYGKYTTCDSGDPQWICEKKTGFVRCIETGTVGSKQFVMVVPHPDNDPDLVREIEEERRKP